MAHAVSKRISRADIAVLIGCLAVCYGVAAISGAITAATVDTWYAALAKPSFTPPDWVFSPVWLTLYGLMAVAAWLVYRHRRRPGAALALALFIVQLVFNLAWSLLFFGLQWIEAALVEIAVLLALVAVTTVLFWRVERWAAVLFAPYLLWLGFATYLNAGIWRLN